MSNSALVSYTKLSPNHSGARTHAIDRITPHCVVGQASVESLGALFSRTTTRASCNYAIGCDGRVVLIVDEGNRSWCSSSNSNDQRAVTIECASDKDDPYAFRDAVYERLVELCADICRRNGKKRLLWLEDKDKTLAYDPAPEEMVLTVHRWFANKACPGDWLMARMGDLARRVTEALVDAVTPHQSPAATASPQGEAKVEGEDFDMAKLKEIRKGSAGAQVKAMQMLLISWGCSCGKYGADGVCGALTDDAIRRFQRMVGITADGICGPVTWGHLLGVQ